MILRKGEGDIQSRHLQYAQTALEEAMATAPTLDYHCLRRGTNMGTWLTVLLSSLNGMDLGYQERHNDLFLHYGIDPPDLPNHCDVYNAKYSIRNTMDCKKGGLNITHKFIIVGLKFYTTKNLGHMRAAQQIPHNL